MNFIFLVYFIGLISLASEESREQAMQKLCCAIEEKEIINRRLQEVLVAKEEVNAKLQLATQAKTEFISNLSHGTFRFIIFFRRCDERERDINRTACAFNQS